ncbi:MAG: tetratricopeptide repeat protein, partial [bacterium]
VTTERGAWRTEGKTQNSKLKTQNYLYLFAFTLGLSFTHHMQTIYLVPASIFFIIAVYWKKWRQQNPTRKPYYYLLSTDYSLLLKLLGLFILPLFLYLYLPIRASTHPVYNWGDPQTLKRFIIHITGQSYGHYFISDIKGIYKNLNDIIHFLTDQFTLYIVGMAMLGGIILLLRRKTIGLFFTLIILTNIIYSIKYVIPNIEDYYIPTYIIFSVSFPLFILIIKGRNLLFLMICVFFIFPVILFLRHYSYNDREDYYFAYDYSRNILHSLSSKAVAFGEGDAINFPSYYLQYCEKYCLDIVLISPALSVNEEYFDSERMWFSKIIKEEYPERDIVSPCQKSKVDLNNTNDIINKIMSKDNSVSVFLVSDGTIANNYILIPIGILSRVSNKGIESKQLYNEIKQSSKNFLPCRGVLDNNKIFKDPMWTWGIVTNYAVLYNRRGSIYFNLGKYKDAIKEYSKSLKIKCEKKPYFVPYGNYYDNWIDKYKEIKKDSIEKIVKAYSYIGNDYMKKGLYLEALNVYEKAIKIQPDNIELRNIRGYIYASRGMYNEAIVELKKAIKINPMDIKSHMNLASAYYKKGLWEEAIFECNCILELDPSNTYANQMLQTISKSNI